MDKTIRKYASFDEMKADEYRYWQSRPVHERTDAVSELTREQYAMKGRLRMYPDFKELLSILNAQSVKYLVIGGYAVSIHAQPRATKDLDSWTLAAGNAAAVLAALAQFGAPLAGLTAADFAEPGPFFRMGREPIAVDILTEIPGVDFDAAWERRVEGIVDSANGGRAYFISRDDLLAAKRASGRPQDMADVSAIQNAAREHGK